IAWSRAFKQFYHSKTSNNRIVIRLFVADPVALCYALQERNAPETVVVPVNYSLPWSATPLKLDGDSYTADTKDPAPRVFNVIDTSNITDHAGPLSVLIATIPLLERAPMSTIITETTTPHWSQETSLVHVMVSGLNNVQTNIIFSILGIAPLAYLTKIAHRGLGQDTPTVVDFSQERPGPIS